MIELIAAWPGGAVHTLRVTHNPRGIESGPASELYEARLVRLEGHCLSRLLFDLIEFFLGLWLPDELPDPRYRVVVRRGGSGEGVGVATARTRRTAERRLQEVQEQLTALTATAARNRWDLDH